MKDKVNISAQFYLNDIELNISVKEDMSKHEKGEPLHRFGHIQITDGTIDDKPIFWDGIPFFIECGKKEFKKECGKDLKKKGYEWKETYKIIKKLLKTAKKLNVI